MAVLRLCPAPIALLGLAGCGGGGTEPPAPPPTLLALTHLEGGGAPPADTRVLSIPLPASPTDWTVEAPLVEIVGSGGERALHLRGGEAHTLRVPGRFEPGTFDLLAVEVVAGMDVSLRAGLARSGEVTEERPAQAGSTTVGFGRAGQRRRLEFDLRRVADGETSFDELVLLANGQTLDWSLVGIELLRREAVRWLPPVERPELVELEGEARLGFGLASGSPVGGRVEVPEGGVLTLSLARAPGGGRGGRGEAKEPGGPVGTLRVLARSPGSPGTSGPSGPPGSSGEVLARVPCPPRGWGHTRIDLAPHGGRLLDLVFTLEGGPDAGDPSAWGPVVLAEPVVFAPRSDPLPPTVLLVTSDTHRGDHLGLARRGGAGGVEVRTPSLDRLAREGVLFEDCFASSNLTLPSHVALMTGTHPRDTGVIDNRTRLEDRAETLAERFHRAGYATFAATSVKHMNHPWSGLGQGFERMAWPTEDIQRPAGDTVEELLSWLDDARGRPLFLWLHLFDAHRPYAPPPGFAEDYYDPGRDPFDRRLPPLTVPAPPGLEDLRDRDWALALYRGEVSYLDQELGRVLAHPRLAAAVVAVTGDHGESFGEQGLWWDHVGVYPSVLHVPLLLRWPGGPAGKRVGSGVRNYDLARTLLGLAGLETEGFGGVDLVALVREGAGGAGAADEPRFAIGSDGHAVALTSGGWHLVLNLYEGSKPHLTTRDNPGEHPLELFDLRADPRCEQDLSAAQPTRTARMCRALIAWLEDGRGSLALTHEPSPEAARLLGALGYATHSDHGGPAFVDLERVRQIAAPFLE